MKLIVSQDREKVVLNFDTIEIDKSWINIWSTANKKLEMAHYNSTEMLHGVLDAIRAWVLGISNVTGDYVTLTEIGQKILEQLSEQVEIRRIYPDMFIIPEENLLIETGIAKKFRETKSRKKKEGAIVNEKTN